MRRPPGSGLPGSGARRLAALCSIPYLARQIREEQAPNAVSWGIARGPVAIAFAPHRPRRDLRLISADSVDPADLALTRWGRSGRFDNEEINRNEKPMVTAVSCP
jgi:hypothetical protein